MSAPTDHETIHAQLGAYFDGELAPDDERAVLEHVADCESCQAALDDLMGLHVALGRKSAASAEAPVSKPADGPSPRLVEAPIISLESRRSRRGVVMVGAVLAAAAAVAVVVSAPWKSRTTEPRIALADTRPVEVRFSATAFADHRPYRVDRGGSTVTPIPLATLSALERRGDRAGLIAALVWSGDRARAAAVLDAMTVTPAVLADQAAVELLNDQPEQALAAADRALAGDEGLSAARWNRALALRDLQLPLAAAAELERLAKAGEPGWAAEADERARASREEYGRRRAPLIDAAARRRAALTGGPPLTEADVAVAQTEARAYFHEALRVATSPSELDRLAGLAAALDRAGGADDLTRELARIRATDLAVRGRFVDRYRAVASGQASAAEIDALIADVRRAGPALDDLRLGVILAGRKLAERLDEVEAIVAGTSYPLFRLLPVQQRFAERRVRPGDRELADAVCDNGAWALRCGAIDQSYAEILYGLGQVSAAERLARRALARFVAAGIAAREDAALELLGEILRLRGRLSLAGGIIAELRLRADATDCTKRGYVTVGAAELERRSGALGRARRLLAEVDACPAAIDGLAIAAAVELALDSGDPGDRVLAERWIAGARGGVLPASLLDVGEARLHLVDASDRSRRVLLDVVSVTPAGEHGPAIADWAARGLIADDGRRGDWSAVIDHTLIVLHQGRPDRCVIALAADEATTTAAWRDANGAAGGAQWTEPSPWPALPPDALAGCTSRSVVALSPLHGRPPPWPLGVWAWNTGRAAAQPSTTAPQTLIVAATSPPHELLDLPELAPVPIPPGVVGLSGSAATPSRVASAMATATYVELHAHGLVDLDVDDGGFVALSPDVDGDWRLTASDVRKLELAGAPVVVLAACRAAEAATDQLRRWSLPDAFLAAGARAVIAADVEVPDDLIRAFVDDVRGRLDKGEAPAVAAAAARSALVARDPKSASWVERLMVFE